MDSRISNFWLIILIASGLFLVWYFKAIIIFILIAALLSLVLSPVVNGLHGIRIYRWHVPRWTASLFSLFMLLFLAICFFYFFFPLLLREAQVLFDLSPQQLIDYFEGPLNNLEAFLARYEIAADPRSMLDSYIKDTVMSIFDISIVTGLFNSLFSLTLDAFVAVFSVFFITFFFLKEERMFPNIILAFTPDKHIESVKKVLGKLQLLLTRYFLGLLIQIVCIAFFASVGLTIVGVENPVLIGVFAGVTNIIPYLGPVLGASFGIISGIIGNLNLPFYPDVTFLLLQIMLVFVIVQQLDNLIFQPVIYSTSVKAHPVEIFIVILMAARLAGIPGMIIAIPAYTVIRVIAKEFLIEFKIVQKLTQNL